MIKLQTVKGTHDLLGKSSIIIDDIIDISEKVSKKFNFEKISTPILEFSELFSGTLGQVSDIVEKEMYNFVDRGNESLTLRPEGTAPVARALINKPSVIFADEPSGNLDSANAKKLHKLFFELRERHDQTFVIVTHNREFAEMSDRMLEMKDGLIIH